MATRSMIALDKGDGKYDAVYCHFDGYPSGVGATLQQFYNTKAAAEELIAGGDLSALRENLTDTFYYTQRGEPLRIRRGLTLEELEQEAMSSWCEYLYTFQDNSWKTTTL